MLVEAIATKPMGPTVTGPLAGNLPWSSLVQTLGHARKWRTSYLLPAGVCNRVIMFYLDQLCLNIRKEACKLAGTLIYFYFVGSKEATLLVERADSQSDDLRF